MTLLFATVAFSVVYGYLMAVRTRVGRIEDRAAGAFTAELAPRARSPLPALAAALRDTAPDSDTLGARRG
jgi:hypothetical protein